MRSVIDRRSRADLFASEILRQDAEKIKIALRERKIVVGIDKRPALSRQGQIGLVTAVNILTRLGGLAPVIYLDVPDNIRVLPGIPLLPASRSLRHSVLAFMEALAGVQPARPIRALAQKGIKYELGLFIGRRTARSKKVITIGSNDWLAVINPAGRPEVLRDSSNPLGIVLAAALSSTELVKHLWMPIKDEDVTIEPLSRRTVVSSYDFSVNAVRPENPALPSNCRLGHACIFGLGATGSACNFVLGCFDRAGLSVDMVDNDVIELSNEERLFTSADPTKDVRSLKVNHAQQFLQDLNRNAYVFANRMTFERFVDTLRDRLSYVFCCLDNVTGRRTLQSELASVVANGGTDLSRWMVSIHDFERPENACLLDLYKEQPEEQPNSVRDLVELLKMSREDIRRLEQLNRRIDGAMIIKAQQQEPDPLRKKAISRYTGLTFEQALAHICTTGAPGRKMPAATISFVSLVPAVFMVSDFIKRRALGRKPGPGSPNVFQADSFRSFEKGIFLNILAAENCFCQSKRYKDAFAKRQEIRRPHLNRIFTSPGFDQAGNAVPSFHNRPVNLRTLSINQRAVKPPPATNALNAPKPIFQGRVNHLPGMRLCVLGLLIYLVVMLILLFVLSLSGGCEYHFSHF
jgi:molybdopterin/thiamine biosynthesis adenylyltransferase